MTTLTSEEIAKFRSELAGYSEATEALNTIEECDGSLEDATALIAIRSGASPGLTQGDSLLSDLVKHARKHLCEPDYKDRWTDLKDVLGLLKEFLPPPAPLAVACVIKLSDIGLRNLCKINTET